jgi:hypothetical protein
MSLTQILYTVLVSGAGLVASGAVSEFAKGAGKTAFDALKNRLQADHGMKSLTLLDDAAQNPAFESAIKAELDKPQIAGDPEVLKLAETLRELIAALPAETQARYAVDIEEISSGGVLLFEAVQGVKAKSATSEGDMTFKNVTAPPGKS